jgi:2-polyprenyl-3-methyl-5-hydroxy-6-metoxy-1,4-benzoquinol methylase
MVNPSSQVNAFASQKSSISAPSTIMNGQSHISEQALDPTAPDVIKNPLLKNVPNAIIRRAWFTMAHLVLAKGSGVLDIRCQTGIITYTMAVLNPEIDFIGMDRDVTLVDKAKKKYNLPNLKFVGGEIEENFVPKSSIDAIVNSFTLHEIYSENNCSEKSVMRSLERQFELLKDDGYIFIQGHFMSPEADYVLLEIREETRKRKLKTRISDIELLTLYSEHARSRDNDSYRGFYLEELPPRFPRTRLFRLPAKWAHEFVLRRDNRKKWLSELHHEFTSRDQKRQKWLDEIHKEYTFFTAHDFDRTLKNNGARILYSAPYWDEQIIKNRFQKIRFYSEDGSPLASWETSFVIVAQKKQGKRSLLIQERKPCRNENPNLRITAMHSELDGIITDIVSRDMHLSEFLPYRITKDNKLHVMVHEGVARALTNIVPRNSPNIDGKKWSGHMTEAISLPQEMLEKLDLEHFRSTLNFSKNYLGLTPQMSCLFEKGPGFYPAPNTIDEHIQTYYINVKPLDEPIPPKIILEDADGFSIRGRIREIDAQQILNAIGVGFIPTSRLELQILALYEKLELPYQAWADCPLTLQTEEPEKTTKLDEIIAKYASEDTRYKERPGTTGQIKAVQSVFVDEGQVDGGIKGLASRDMDFILHEENSMNTAVVLPLTKKINGEVMAGIVEQYLPIPQRYRGNGYTVNCPSFNLPSDIKNIEMARKYIADKFEVPVECVSRMGESFYSHIGVMPQRIYPFAVSTAGASGWKKAGRTHGATTYTPLYRLYRLLYLDNDYSFMKVVAMAYQACLGQGSDLSANMSFSQKHADRKGHFIGMDYSPSSTMSSSSSSKDLINDK